MSYRIVVGLPSWNECETIGKVALDLDAALTTLPFEHDAVIVNADNSSDDGTPSAFMNTDTRCQKHVLSTPRRGGKGANWRAILDYAKTERAEAVLFVDSDLAEVSEGWVHALIGGVRGGLDFCYPLRPPTWNGGDLTYHLAYPLLAGIFGADLREPLCGDIAVSASAMADLAALQWQPAELRFGVDFLAASVAVSRTWGTIQLETRRRNKLRSFSLTPDEDYRMGDKFAEVSAAVGYRCAERLRHVPPKELQPATDCAPVDPAFIVPSWDADVAALAASTARRLRIHADQGEFAAFSSGLADRLTAHARGTEATSGMGWTLWRSCLFEWISQLADEGESVDPELLETLFLNRVVGHHSQIAGSPGWYQTVVDQAIDTFRRRHSMWRHVASGRPGV